MRLCVTNGLELLFAFSFSIVLLGIIYDLYLSFSSDTPHHPEPYTPSNTLEHSIQLSVKTAITKNPWNFWLKQRKTYAIRGESERDEYIVQFFNWLNLVCLPRNNGAKQLFSQHEYAPLTLVRVCVCVYSYTLYFSILFSMTFMVRRTTINNVFSKT